MVFLKPCILENILKVLHHQNLLTAFRRQQLSDICDVFPTKANLGTPRLTRTRTQDKKRKEGSEDSGQGTSVLQGAAGFSSS